MKYRDALGYLAHKRHIVLDHDQGMFALETVDDLRGHVGFRLRHAGGRLIEQNHLRILRDQKAQFEPLGFTVAQIGGQPVSLFGQTDQLEHMVDILIGLLAEATAQTSYNVSHAGARELVQEIQRECPAVAQRASEFLLRDVRVAPTLMKYAEPSSYEIETRLDLSAAAAELLAAVAIEPAPLVDLLDDDPLEVELATTLLDRKST